jgi:hypothetical protein
MAVIIASDIVQFKLTMEKDIRNLHSFLRLIQNTVLFFIVWKILYG